jgi:hypothetical protein
MMVIDLLLDDNHPVGSSRGTQNVFPSYGIHFFPLNHDLIVSTNQLNTRL